jgi:hypothetical protein
MMSFISSNNVISLFTLLISRVIKLGSNSYKEGLSPSFYNTYFFLRLIVRSLEGRIKVERVKAIRKDKVPKG